MKALNLAGATIASTTQTIAPGNSTPTITTGADGGGNIGLLPQIPPNSAGPVILIHDGPPGSVLVDGFQGFFGASFATIPIVFRPVREKQ